jgi:alkaline phosphatase D
VHNVNQETVKSHPDGSDRRQFLKLVVAVAGGAWGSTGCGSSASGGGGDPGPTPSGEYFPQSIASGDPRPSSVVLWTRLIDPERPGDDLELELEVARDEEFEDVVELSGGSRMRVTAEAASDGCVKVLVRSLEPATTYYYRFLYGEASSRVGRTRTAPSDAADVSVRFGVVSCQDYDGKYYHVLRRLLVEDLDFVVHLGDYVYEGGSADPSEVRDVVFGRPGEALGLGEAGGRPFVARSVDNYRDLYRTIRSDRDLQALHERVPFIVIPDDHEFSDDSHGATATYFDGQRNETDLDRKRASDRAWFEYMPVDYTSGIATALNERAEFPADFRIYRSFGFGRHLELVMTDLRRYRPDHLVPEDAFPGSVYLRASELAGDDAAAAIAVPYVDVDEFEGGIYADALRDAAKALGFRESSVTGLLSVTWINSTLTQIDFAPEPIAETEAMERGLAYHQLMKTEEFSRVGSRYFVAQAPLEALAAARLRQSDGASENLMGDAQRAWFLETLKASERTFKVWGSEIAFMAKHLDLTGFGAAPPGLQQRIGLTAEDWDGFPNERRSLLRELEGVENIVVLAGDLHCFFAGTPYDPSDESRRFVEFVIGSVTSQTWKDGLTGILEAAPSLPPMVAEFAPYVGNLLMTKTPRANPHMAFQELGKNGCGVVTVTAEAFEIELLMIDPQVVATAPEELDGELSTLFDSVRFRVPAEGGGLEREAENGGFERWDVEDMDWRASG